MHTWATASVLRAVDAIAQGYMLTRARLTRLILTLFKKAEAKNRDRARTRRKE